jgi:hypothetical protein
MKGKLLILCGIALLAFAAVAAAATFEPVKGTGYVSKADVMTAFGWSETTFQRFGRVVTFVYAGKPGEPIRPVSSHVEFSGGQVAGYHLTGFGGTPVQTFSTLNRETLYAKWA